jgi:lysophospholipase L1-like esterase
MKRHALFLALFVLLSLAVTFAAGEWYVRSQGRFDADGTFFFREQPIRPYALPVTHAKEVVDRYLKDSSGFLLYDPDLGWANRPRTCTPEGRYCANSFGLRADREYTAAMRPGSFRVSMFGDSFVAGFDADFPDSFAVQVQNNLKARGLDAEVLNFGVGGFGFDQAYLYYNRDASRFDTNVIVQGLQMENVGRDVTLFRIVAFPGTGIPFSKPRYILNDGKLELINHPTIPPEDVPKTLANFHRWPLAKYEPSYSGKYQHHWYTPSKLLSTLIDLKAAKEESPQDLFTVDGEAMNITVALLERYRAEVAETGKPFVLIYFPRADVIDAILAGKPDPWQPHLDRLKGFTIVDPTPRLVAYAKEHGTASLYGGHYSPIGYRLVAESLAEALAPLARK